MPRLKKKPVATDRQLEAIEQVESGNASIETITQIRLLTDECGRYGCVYTKPSKASPGMDECPGWCDVAQDAKEQLKRMSDALRSKATIKPGHITRKEKQAIKAFDEGSLLSCEQVFTLELLAAKCRADGCIHRQDKVPKSKITTCSGWCAKAKEAFVGWWYS